MESISPITLRKALDALVMPTPDAPAAADVQDVPEARSPQETPRRIAPWWTVGVAAVLCAALTLGVVWL